MKETLIIGATPNPSRFAYKAAYALRSKGFPFVLFGNKKGEVLGQTILNEFPVDAEIDTVTLYVSAPIQPEYYSRILALKPRRIIFNPGTENPEFEKMAEAEGVEALRACTLVMLSTGQW